MKFARNDSQKGLIALTTVFIILVTVLVMGVSLGLNSVGDMKMGLQKTFSSKVYYLSNLCAEQALMKLKENPGYSGNENIEIEGGSCQILPVEGRWIVKTMGSYKYQIKKIRIVITKISPQMTISSWEEVANF